jgi:hypothetical protein
LVEHLIPFRHCGHSYPWIGDAALAQECNAVFAKAIACSDVPLPEIRLYDTDRTILLPSEC